MTEIYHTVFSKSEKSSAEALEDALEMLDDATAENYSELIELTRRMADKYCFNSDYEFLDKIDEVEEKFEQAIK